MNGKAHDTAGMLTTVAIAAITQDLTAIAGSFVGFLWLSPDLDLWHSPRKSKVLNRWGPLKFIWAPFAVTVAKKKHRGLTHIPVLGSLAIQAYLFLPFLILLRLLLWDDLSANWQENVLTHGSVVCRFIVVQQLIHVGCDWIADAWKYFLKRSAFKKI